MKKINNLFKKKVIGILGNGELGKSIAKICKEAGFKILIKEINYDEIQGKKVDVLHVNIPEKTNSQFIKIVVKSIKESSPKLTVINTSTTPGTTRQIFQASGLSIVHSPVIGIHPKLYDSIKFFFPKIIGPIDNKSLRLAKSHFKNLGLRIEIYDSPEDTEVGKLLDLTYYAWNIIFCKWVAEICKKYKLNFYQVYTLHNKIYNKGYSKILPNVVRPVLIPVRGPIGGHCTIPDTILFHKFYKNRFTKFILDENKKYLKEKISGTKKFKKIQIGLIKKMLRAGIN